MSFKSVHDYVQAMQDGKIVFGQFRKAPSWASVANWWVDLSMAAGNPAANFYASTPLVGATLSRWDSIFHGDNYSPSELYLKKTMLTASAAGMVGQFKLCDYLLYYPFVDMDSLDPQPMDAGVTAVTLPRYTTGAGVQVVAICQAPTAGGGSFNFTYVNQSGATVTSPTNYCGTTGAGFANIVTSQPATVAGYGPFLRLNGGDTGVRQIVSYQSLVSNGGLCCLALVKPLFDMVTYEASTTCELEMLSVRSGAIRIYDGAFLGLLAQTGASVAATTLIGQFEFVWT